MIELIKAYGFVTVQQAFLILYSLIRTKVISSNLGAEGLGIFAQTNILLLLFFQLATFGTTVALNTSVAELVRKNEKKKLSGLIAMVWGVNNLVGLVILAGAGIFADQLSIWAFGSTQYSRYIFIAALGGFTFIQVRFLVNVMRGLMEWRAYSLISSAGLLLGIGIIIYLVISYGLDGAIYSLVGIQLVNLVLMLFFFITSVTKKHEINFRSIQLNQQLLFNVFRIARPVMVILIIEPVAGFLIRSNIIRALGINAGGEYQLLAGLSMAYMNVLKEARLTYALSKASSLLDDRVELMRMQNNNIRLGLFLILPLTVALLAVRENIILLLYSPQFLVVSNLLLFQFIGDILNVVRLNLNFVLIPLKLYRVYLIEGLAYWVGWVFLSAILMRWLGLIAVPLSGIIVTGFILIFSLMYHYKSFGFRIDRVTKRSLLLLVPLGAVGYWWSISIPPGWFRYGCVAVVLLGIFLLMIRQGAHKLLLGSRKSIK
ncbi:MAG: oligosaccharide flippase family protein [Anaerolineae bacterium]|nr:oligosaccharide flippase family protein [Anaerolineae bacterium]MBT7070903.1 oligosaccharide flippase family protein [Anaerolineae bacterium]MBT7324329.1 oligosaccharide flippase family protein [Anaerolineae bacterium]MBT7599796.1 oligosaccharide flippase family protein [Anaerolineae bacterium]